MKFNTVQNLESIAKLIGAQMLGNPSHEITGINEIHVVEAGEIVFVDHPKYYEKALNSNATTILIDKKVDCPEGKALLISEDPFRDFNKINQHFIAPPFETFAQNHIDPSANIHSSVQLGSHITIEADVVIYPNVVIYDHVTIKKGSVIHANTVLGADAFYFQKRGGQFQPMYTCGSILIEENVTIGASCTIDRGVTGCTTIGKGSKLDNQVHIGHDTLIGENCLIAAQVGVAGCVKIKDDVTLWGQAGIPANVTLHEGAVVLGQSAPMSDVGPKERVLGSPALPFREAFKIQAYLKKLPELFKK